MQIRDFRFILTFLYTKYYLFIIIYFHRKIKYVKHFLLQFKYSTTDTCKLLQLHLHYHVCINSSASIYTPRSQFIKTMQSNRPLIQQPVAAFVWQKVLTCPTRTRLRRQRREIADLGNPACIEVGVTCRNAKLLGYVSFTTDANGDDTKEGRSPGIKGWARWIKPE